MKYLLDTDHISVLQRKSGIEFSTLTRRIARVPRSELAFCIVSFHEQVLGCNAYINRAASSEKVVRGYKMFSGVLAAFSRAVVLPFDAKSSAVFENLIANRIRIATKDLRIASIALDQGLIQHTRNLRDFGKVPGLQTENWTI
jgi:tRNA(fMet)-specific endonuclease VapC